ncbi:hypothetical protein [Rhodocista pekingensis]|uniref:Uncharacterized protein n=1 Tax=Rhodocista pekingensis TaxID=201185 RepID=A0ABW2KSM3_9PROT
MTRLRSVKTAFTGGELSPDLLGRGDLRSYETGALALRNVLILPTGGVTRRPGTAYLATLPGPGRLAAFAFDTEQAYLLAFTDRRLEVFRDGATEAVLATPWTAGQLAQLAWTQSADVLLVCHPDVPPRRIVRSGDRRWRCEAWRFSTVETADGRALQRLPFHRFADAAVTLTPSGTRGRVRVRASAPVFDGAHAGRPFRLRRRQGLVVAVRSPTLAEIDLLEALPDAAPSIDWDEPAFSPLRGWPVSACFHQDRLVIGGSRDLPNRLWLSRSGDLFDFDPGEGEDDEAIEFAILSDQVNAIRQVFSGRHLQVFTTGAEWAVTGEPLTPKEVRLDRQSRVGSGPGRQIPAREVDGATLFAGRDGAVREFLWTDLESSYSTTDLTLAAGHLCRAPVELDVDPGRRLLLAVQADGGVAALTLDRAEQVTGWTRLETDGAVRSLAVVRGEVHWLVERQGRWMLEQWEDGLALDSALSGLADPPTPRWSGLSHLEGRRVAIVADGCLPGPAVVEAGRLRLDRPAGIVTAGLPYTHRVEPLPPNALAPEGQGRALRPLAVTFRVAATPALRADLGRGMVEVPLRRMDQAPLSSRPAAPFTGDRRLAALGWVHDRTRPLWRIEEDRPLPFTLLSATLELKVND